MGSGYGQSIYGGAANAIAEGERGLAQDAFGRQLQATQLGMQGMGAGAQSLEDLLGSGFTSNKEVLAMALQGAEAGGDIVSQLVKLLGGKFTVG